MYWQAVVVCALAVYSVLEAQEKSSVLPSVQPVSFAEFQKVLAEHRGNVVVVNTWASWCAPCKKEMPELVKLGNAYAGKSVVLVLLSADDSEVVHSKVRPTLAELGVDFPTYLMNDSSDAAFINGLHPKWSGALPTTFVYDRNGVLADMLIGRRTYEQFEASVKKALSRRR
jgi:thiol-disulfide isomerase/thioredoxin